MSSDKVFALVDYEDNYVQPLLLAALSSSLPPEVLVLIRDLSELPSPAAPLLQWRQYESIDFDHLMGRPSSSLSNSYVIRKALIRKHFLSNTISHWLSKHADSTLKNHVKQSVEFEVDYAEFLDDALLEAYELHESWTRNAVTESAAKEWWILKPGMSERGQGIRLFSTEAELTDIFEEWEPASDEDEDENQEAEQDGGEETAAKSNGIMTSHLRHFVAQPYIHPPLLMPSQHPSTNRKFHIRTYVLAVGALKVYVYKPMLALFAAQTYTAPSVTPPNESLTAHLTNTCLQSSNQRDGAVHTFWSLPKTLESLPSQLQDQWQEDVWQQICKTTAVVFESAARTSLIHFQPLPNAFEIFGVDFLVDAEGCAWLLEVNAFPDFAQTGSELQGVIEGLMRGVVEKAVLPFFGFDGQQRDEEAGLVEVLDLDLGKR